MIPARSASLSQSQRPMRAVRTVFEAYLVFAQMGLLSRNYWLGGLREDNIFWEVLLST
jgi:hypothetical protein